MSGLTSALQTASTALSAFSTALGVESTNVSNSATPGYAAQRAVISPILNGGVSGGSDLVTITSAGDARADALVQASSSEAGWSGALVSQLSPINSAFDITGSSGVLAAFQQFSSAFANAAANPDSQSLRGLALSAAGTVANAFRTTANTLSSQLAQVKGTIRDNVSQINALANQIQQINVAATSPGGTASAGDPTLRNALDQLSSLVNITVQTNANGTVDVLAGGQVPLVEGDQVYAMSVDTTQPAGSQVSSAGWGVTSANLGGQLGSLLQVANTTIPALIGSSTQQGSLNQLAQSFADSANALFTSGLTTAGQPGAALFTYDSTNGGVNVASSLGIDPSVTADQLALASATQSNGTANALSQIASSTNPAQQIAGLSPQDFFASIAAGVGQQLSTATGQASVDQTNLTSAQANRAKTSGVSLDTEAVNITAYQRAYEASARVVSVIDQLTAEEMQIIT